MIVVICKASLCGNLTNSFSLQKVVCSVNRLFWKVEEMWASLRHWGSRKIKTAKLIISYCNLIRPYFHQDMFVMNWIVNPQSSILKKTCYNFGNIFITRIFFFILLYKQTIYNYRFLLWTRDQNQLKLSSRVAFRIIILWSFKALISQYDQKVY